ncbi:extracellular solute-binding protein, family 3 [Georgenia satyanarayanai]|uniref:Extracellular solute-binding protein, family 3 n=1 Tax=Georgenia satyanarayanai TaxID=860221 RepID=A0A2Y9AA85_9MICO|nr:transporter substrate-binding domain-containing protein [Georgenia satyanarayanai]PYG00938.1 extracellular solute-binding protein (family 3) [Georgenia satyanarayanai]SSA39177.1 extracellular solute-binding protein, family 3 [Georgenia satyanarayanai]
MRRAISCLALLATLTACSATIPTDPDGTLDRVTGGILRVGVSPSPPWTDLPDGPGGEPAGTEVELVEDFARTIDAQVQWAAGGEEELIGQLERGELDLVIGGLSARSPWAEKAALTYRYTETTGPDGAKELHVMAAPMGENAFLVELEGFLLEKDL